MQTNVGSILDKGGVDHGMLPRRSGSRGILGSHPLAAECTKACSTAAWISKYHDRVPPIDVGCGSWGRACQQRTGSELKRVSPGYLRQALRCLPPTEVLLQSRQCQST
jgi:hypothetical protein